ncbi:MAG: hypothetical protein ACKOYJ_10065, partial [Planctomycetia bacterium]
RSPAMPQRSFGKQKLCARSDAPSLRTSVWGPPRLEVAGGDVTHEYHRCNQENLFAHLTSDMHALSAPVDTLVSNRAYMVMASLPCVFRVLAWNRWLPAFFRLLDRLHVPIRC